ncbi:hypothetical protein PR202_ga04615 [Eleusine coracana subsp. coracana]|uniref:Uncharacterized protein n=1 Tax=Eleusine coracana subsp. coracana TaxID=191504 RepID=A0AAV5BRF7_ELECO|nr:hypothetical protein PR202_ga04615 [Eleusine coracana subsp. coracana]
MTSSLLRAFMNVLGVELPYINHLQSSTQGVAGQHSMRDFLGPSDERRTLTGGGQKSHVLPVEDIWGMYSKVRGLKRQQTSDTVLTAFHSSSFQPQMKPECS